MVRLDIEVMSMPPGSCLWFYLLELRTLPIVSRRRCVLGKFPKQQFHHRYLPRGSWGQPKTRAVVCAAPVECRLAFYLLQPQTESKESV
jgi:hypothetical protein